MHHRGTEDAEGSDQELTYQIIGAAIAVHRVLGPGLLESAYETCLAYELWVRGVRFERQVPLPLTYRGISLRCGYRLDLVVERRVIVEVKSIRRVKPIHRAQVLTYLRLRHLRLGLLVNFNVDVLRRGICRIVNG